MKIVFLIENISGGGAERVTCLLAEALEYRGYEVSIITNTFRPFAYQVNDKIKRLQLLKSEEQYKSRFFLLSMLKNVRQMVKEIQPDVIIGVLPVMNLIAILSSLQSKTKVIATDHTSFDRKFSRRINFIRNYVYRLADAVTVLTQTDFDYIGSRLPQKIVMPNPLAFQCVTEYRNNRRKNILAAGRLDIWKVKGFDLLIKAWAKIASEHPDWVLEIAGDGKESSLRELQKIANDNHVASHVHFLGFRKNLDSVMRESSIFVLSSLKEGFGMVLIEAMSQGCACISFDDGGRQSEIILDETQGIIVKERSINALAAALVKLIEDDSLRHELARNGIKRACHYEVSKIADMWDNLLKKILLESHKN